MKVEIFRKTETAELQGASLHESYYPPLPPESYGPGATPFPPPFTPEDREYPIRELVKAIDLGPCGGLSYERHYYVFADLLVNEAWDNHFKHESSMKEFWRDMVEGREKEAKLLGDELKEARNRAIRVDVAIRDKDWEIARLGRRMVWFRKWAWVWAGAAMGLLIPLALAVFR